MALSKNITTDNGFVTSYHKVDSVCLDGNTLDFNVESFVSKEYRELGRPAERIFFNFEITVEEEESMGIRQLAYKKIKELPQWADAEDC